MRDRYTVYIGNFTRTRNNSAISTESRVLCGDLQAYRGKSLRNLQSLAQPRNPRNRVYFRRASSCIPHLRHPSRSNRPVLPRLSAVTAFLRWPPILFNTPPPTSAKWRATRESIFPLLI